MTTSGSSNAPDAAFSLRRFQSPTSPRDPDLQIGREYSVTGEEVARRPPQSVHIARQIKETANFTKIDTFSEIQKQEKLYQGNIDALLSEYEMLKAIPKQEFERAVRRGDVSLCSYNRDFFIDTDNRVIFLLAGQVAIALFETNFVNKEKKSLTSYQRSSLPNKEQEETHRIRQRGPLISAAKRNLLTFNRLDVFDTAELRIPETLVENSTQMVAFSVTPALLLVFSKNAINRLYASANDLQNRQKNGVQLATDLFRAIIREPARGEIADFYIRNGKSVANVLRVRHLDLCIQCYECEKACADRFGKTRLVLEGKIKGAIDLVNCCQTCSDQRCVQVCRYNAINYDSQAQEVLIDEEACTGCGDCKVACPYDAISLPEEPNEPKLWKRLQKEKKLGHGEGTKRKLPLLRIAQKCSHCNGLDDQACISACPTGALTDWRPSELFVERTATIVTAAQTGHKNNVTIRTSELFKSENFFEPRDPQTGSKMPIMGEAARRKWAKLWVFSLAIASLVTFEILMENFGPAKSLLYFILRQLQPDTHPMVTKLSISYRPSSGVGFGMGIVGTVLLAISVAYALFSNFPRFRLLPRWLSRKAVNAPHSLKSGAYERVAKLFSTTDIGAQHWFYLHMWSGTLGALCIIAHSRLRVDPHDILLNPPSRLTSLPAMAGFWSLLGVLLFGLLARYLAPFSRRLRNATRVRTEEIRHELHRLRQAHNGLVDAMEYFEQYLLKRFDHIQYLKSTLNRSPYVSALNAYLWDMLIMPWRYYDIYKKLEPVSDKKARWQAASLLVKMSAVVRREKLLPELSPWSKMIYASHILAAMVLSIVSLVHISYEIYLRF